jgi:hypothetical protein
MSRATQALDFQAKLSIMFDDVDAFPSDTEKKNQDANRRRLTEMTPDAGDPKPLKTDAEPGCLPFAVRRMRAESNPSLRDFIRRLQDMGKHKAAT